MDRIKDFWNRRLIQILTLIGTNSYFQGFMNKTIFKGSSKALCVPFMNCYSCPGARFSCPIGALQAVYGKRKKYFSFYVLGIILLFGIFLGRFICGFLCPFGFVQDMLDKLSKKNYRVPKILKMIKYLVLILFVIILPMFFVNSFGMGDPYFCKLICPVGTLEGGIVLVLLKKGLRGAIGFLFYYKLSILIVLLILSAIIYRPFCKVLCPLGAIYGLLNKVSFMKLKINDDLCVSCMKCSKVCKMDVNPLLTPNHSECIRCGECKSVCPTNAISFTFKENKGDGENVKSEKQSI